jgi:nicotinate phosphoribosyltransferase
MDAKGFADYLRMSSAEFSPPVRSLMDVDFYKFTMGQLIQKHFRGTQVTFQLIVRDPVIRLADLITEEEIRSSLDYAMGLRFSKTDIYYLRGMDLYERYMFNEDYLGFLAGFSLPPYSIRVRENSFELTFTGDWAEVSMWETIALAIISELYYRAILRKIPKHVLENIYRRAQVRIYEKLEKVSKNSRIRFADFGQRRRHSFLWQEWVIGLCKEMIGEQFTGTSNTWMAFHHNLTPIGTNAHELPMVLTALADSDEDMRLAQYRVLELWQELYGQGLRIFLPDTYGSSQFFAGAPDWIKDWRGHRQDSGDPLEEADKYICWLEDHGVDPTKRLTIFSDGLDVNPMVIIDCALGDVHQHSFGWGTLLTNDFAGCDSGIPELRPFSMVCKVVSANGRPCVKLSNNRNKAVGPPAEVQRYIKIFGQKGIFNQTVRV